MIHFTCDVCRRSLDSDNDMRYVIRMEVYAALDGSDTSLDGDRDHLQEIHDILERLDDFDAQNSELGDDVYQQLRFDLCSECRQKFLQDPLGRRFAQQLDFSKN